MARLKLWIPGPTEVSETNLARMAEPPIGHRGPEIRELVASLKPGLRSLLGTEEVFVMTSSATTVMESGIRNLAAKKVMVFSSGAFGKRWHQIAQANGIESELFEVPFGQPILPEHVAEHLKDHDAACFTYSETSTGVLNPIRELAAAVRARGEASILVDAVSALSAVEMSVDDLGIDLLLAGVQKAMALPPGIAVYGLSQRALDKAETVPHRGFTTDFLKVKSAMDKDQTPATPSVSHLYALKNQLDAIEAEGMSARAARHREMSDRTIAWAVERGHEVLAAEGYRSPTVTCLKAKGLPPADLLSRVAESHGVRLGGGYGDLKPEWFRIGHFGEHRLEDLEGLLGAIDGALA